MSTMTVPAQLQPALGTHLLPVQRQRLRPFLSSCHKQSRRALGSHKAGRCRAAAETQTDDRPELQIEGIQSDYCDEFVCTSSPQVESNLRALARDVVRTSTWTSGLFADEVRYKVSLITGSSPRFAQGQALALHTLEQTSQYHLV